MDPILLKERVKYSVEARGSMKLVVRGMWIMLLVSYMILSIFCSGQISGNDVELINERLREMSSMENKECKKSQWSQHYTSFHSNALRNGMPRVLVMVPFLSGEFNFKTIFVSYLRLPFNRPCR